MNKDNKDNKEKEYLIEIISRSQQSFQTTSEDERHALLKTISYMFKKGLLDPGREQIASFLVRDKENNVYLQAPTVGLDTDLSEYEVLDIIKKLDRSIDVDMLKDFEEDEDF